MAANFADAFSGSGNPFISRSSQRKSKNPFMAEAETPDEPDAGLLSKIGSASLSGLEKVGNLLDVPGSIFRDALAGRNPLDQLMTPFSGENRTTGRELGRHFGLIGDEDTTGNWFGGLGLELLTDPTTYIGLGALTKAGKAAQASGTLTKGLADSIAKGERSLLHAGIPFTDIGTHLGTGKAAQAAAGVLDAVPEMLTKPSKLTGLGLPEGVARAATYPGRMALSLFDPTVMGQVSEAGQKVGRQVYGARQTAERSARQALADVIGDMDETWQAFHDTYGADIEAAAAGQLPGQAKVHQDSIRNTFERVFGLATELGGDLDTALSEFNLTASKLTPKLRQGITDLGNRMQDANRQLHLLNRLKGGKGGILEDLTAQGSMPGFEHFPRYVKPDRLDDFQRELRDFATRHGSTYARDEVISHVPQEVINRILTDPKARDAATGAAHIASEFAPYLGKQMVKDGSGNLVPKWANVAEHAQALSDWARGRKEWALFTRSQIENFFKYQRGANLADQAYDAIHRLIGENLSAGGGALVEDVYRAADMDVDNASAWLGAKLGTTGDAVKKMTIPVDIAKAIVGTRKALSQPEWAGEIGKTIDTLNGWFKQAVTLPFPSFWTRNLTSGQYVNLATGLVENGADMAQYGRHVQDAFGHWRRGLDPAYERELLVNKVLDPDTLFEDVPAYGAAEFGHVSPHSPLDVKSSWNYAGQQVAENPSIFDQIPGVQSARQAYGGTLATGARASRLVEFLNRVPMYEFLKGKGFTAEAAAAKVAELQIDYSALAPFEKQVMRRLIPFYCVPDDTTILTRDGWKSCDEVQVGEQVLTFNRETERTEWQPCRAVNVFDFDGDLLRFANSDVTFRCTGDHRWVVRKQRFDKTWQPPAMLAANRIRGGAKIVVSAPLTAAEDSILSPDDARLLGWAVTDGHSRHRGNHHELVLCQHPNKFLEEVIQVAGSAPRPSAHPNGTVYVTVADDRKQRISAYLDKDTLIRVVTRLSREAAEAMYDAAYKADGTVGTRTGDHLACEHPGKREAFQVLCLLLGKRSSESHCHATCRGLYVSPKSTLRTTTLQRTSEYYRGRVWCPTTDNGTWVMKQGDFITITGNSFQRKIAPTILKTLAQKPGGVMGQTIRLARDASDADATTPDYVSETLSIPNPLESGEGGVKSYWTGFGLPFEQHFQYAGGGVRGALREAASQMTPIAKAPLEWATNQSFFQRGTGGAGRPLDELDPTIGRTLANLLGQDKPVPTPQGLEFLMANSPATRALTTARQLTDPRKSWFDTALNTLTGTRVTDISPAAQDAVLRERALEMMRGMDAASFTRTYFRKDDLADMQPGEREMADRLTQLQTILAQRAKERKLKKAGVAGG